MAARFFLVLCASALLVQTITAYPGCSCGLSGGSLSGAIAGAELAADIAAANSFSGYYPGSGLIYPSPAVASASGGPFSVTLNSPYRPTGLDVVSTNTIEGFLDVFGSLPVFAAVTLDGNVPSSGAAGTSYSCGNGNVGISSESLAAAGFGVGSAIANDVARAEIAGAQLTNAAGYGAALAGAELAAINAGRGLYPQSALYGANGLNAAIAGAELANINAGLGINAGFGINTGLGINAGLGIRPRPCGSVY